MTRLFVAGHSDSEATYLPPGVQPWAERSRAWLETVTEQPCQLNSVRFAPMGARAVSYLTSAIEAASPDIVVIPLTAYPCTVGTVAESVRVRFGERAYRLFQRSEGAFQAKTRQGRARRHVNRYARRIARRVLGTRTLATVQESGDIYEAILHALAQRESTQVIAVIDARFSADIQEREPLLHKRFDELEARLLPIIQQHHFIVADLESALRQAPDRSIFHHDDGVHTTAAFHDVYFGVMREALSAAIPAPR